MAKPEEILKSAREAKGIKQAEMADKIAFVLKQSYSMRQYQRLEKGKFPKYKKEIIKSVDQLLGTNLYDIIYDIDNDGIKNNEKNITAATTKEPELMPVLIRMMQTHNDILKEQKSELIDRLRRMETNLDFVKAKAVSLEYNLLSGREVVLRSLGRIENLSDPDHLFEEAGKINESLVKVKHESRMKTEKDKKRIQGKQ